MKMFRERNTLPLGLIVVVWLVASLCVVLKIDSVVALVGRSYTVELSEAAGLKQGDPVRVNGMRVGRVGEVGLGDQYVEAEFSVTNPDVVLGSETTVEVSVETVLGDKALVLHPSGEGELEAGVTIPADRTTVPYDVSEVLSDVKRVTEPLDTDQLVEALEAVAGTMDQAAPDVEAAVTGIGRIARVIDDRDQQLRELLSRADDFSSILADRSDDLTALMRDGNKLFAELLARRADITAFLGNVSAMAQQLSGLVEDNQDSLRPALRKLNRVLATLNAERRTLDEVLGGFAKYVTALGETVSSGPVFSGYIQNLLPGNFVLPKVDLGSRTGVNGGGR